MNRRGFLRWIGLAPIVGPAVVRTIGDPSTHVWVMRAGQLTRQAWEAVGNPLQRLFMKPFAPDRVVVYPAWDWNRTGSQQALEGIKKIGPGLERYMRVVTERTALGGRRVIEHVEWLVRRGETVDGSTKYFRTMGGNTR